MLLCCLAIATHKVLRYESGDDELVKEVSEGGGAGRDVLMCARCSFKLLLVTGSALRVCV